MNCKCGARVPVTPEVVREALATYTRVHWGERGNQRLSKVGAPNPFSAIPVELGTLRRVEYETHKRGDGPSTYYHDFERPYPHLAFVPGGLLILGGGYTVKTGGITG